jgi:RHS repeat-associated protein
LTAKRLFLGVALIAASAAPLSAGRFVTADAPSAGIGRYRVTLDTTRVDDADAAVSQLLSICHCRIEPYAEEGFTGFLISATPSAARTLSSDPRVSAVEELVSEAAGVIPSVERGTWAGGEAASAPRTETAVATSAPHTPVSNAGITAWDTGTYTYDGSGNIRSIGTTQIYTYDLYGRLAYGKVQASRFQRFSYDRFGNLLNTTTNTDTPPTPQTISGVSNRLSSGGATYDAAGRMLTGTGVAFRYDGDGMPTWSQMAAGSVTQTKVQIYSATDERIASLWIGPANGSDWTIRDAGGQVLRCLHKSTSGQWSWQEDYVYRDGQMLASEVATREKTLHYHLDHLGTPRLITGNGGTQVALHTYDPFGAEVTAANQAGTEPIKKFTGHERDTANVDYMHARYYQNGWGRFLSVDPVIDTEKALKEPQRWNRYAYVINNPLRYTDPDGRETNPVSGQSNIEDKQLRTNSSNPRIGMYGNTRSANNWKGGKHDGVDIAAKKGTPLVAPVGGTAIVLKNHAKGGNVVFIDTVRDGHNIRVGMAHLTTVTIKDGDKVREGQAVGTSGDTGNAKGLPAAEQHVHLSVKVDGVYVDPQKHFTDNPSKAEQN